MKKIGFVIPWYDENIPGGAEAELRGLVHHLSDAGLTLEVLTTCIKAFQSDWNADFYPAGLSLCAGIPVRRFPVRKRDVQAFDAVNLKLMTNQPVTHEEETVFMREMANSPALYTYIREHKDDYEVFVFIPYMFGTTYFGIQECFEKAIMIPCLHDEAYAYMRLFRDTFPKVRGMIFYSEPERELAASLYGVRGDAFPILGAGVHTDVSGSAARFREKYGVNAPFLLYAGRKDAGKKVDVLVEYFSRYKGRNSSALKLILIGGGNITLPERDVIDLGFVPAQDKFDAYSAAAVFCNPSQMESFSIVIMESWLSGTPVLVNGECRVTADFARKAQGGLYYESFEEFEACLTYLLENEAVSEQMGRNGRKFVLEHFSWDVIVEKYAEYFKQLSENHEEVA